MRDRVTAWRPSSHLPCEAGALRSHFVRLRPDAHRHDSGSCGPAAATAVASRLLSNPGMDKEQDADLEKGYETIEDAMYADDDERVVFETDDDDLFAEHVYGDELDYEPEGAFLD